MLDRNRVVERVAAEMRNRVRNLRHTPVDENIMRECVTSAAVAVVDEFNVWFEAMLARADTDLLERAMVALAERVRARERGQELQEFADRERASRRLAWHPPPAHESRIYAMSAFVKSVGGTISMPTHDEIVLEFPDHARDQVEREAQRLHLLNRPPPDERPVGELRRLAARSLVDERDEMARRLGAVDPVSVGHTPTARGYDGRTGQSIRNGMYQRRPDPGRCHGNCSRGGEGPRCMLPGCRG